MPRENPGKTRENEDPKAVDTLMLIWEVLGLNQIAYVYIVIKPNIFVQRGFVVTPL